MDTTQVICHIVGIVIGLLGFCVMHKLVSRVRKVSTALLIVFGFVWCLWMMAVNIVELLKCFGYEN